MSSAYQPQDLTIRQANRPQIIAWCHHAWDHWEGAEGKVTAEEMLERVDWHTANGRHAHDGRVGYWVLVPRDDPATTNILASVRVFKRKALHYDKLEESIEPAVSYVITSVVTPSAHRRKGYANQLLSILHHVLGKPDHLPPFPEELWGEAPVVQGFGDAVYSTLWSDVGRGYYRGCRIGRGPESKDGWIVKQEEQLNWETADLGHLARPPPAHIEIIKDYNFELPPDPIESFERRFLRASSTDHPEKTHIVLDSATSPGLLNFLHVRNHHTSDPSDTYGYISTVDPEVWVVWAIVPADQDDPKTLRITSVGYGRELERDVELLVAITAQQAKEHGCTRITLWGMEGEARRAVMHAVGEGNVEVVRRKEHLGAIAWYGPGEPDEVDWVRVEESNWA